MDLALLRHAIEEAERRVRDLLEQTSEDDSYATQVELRAAAQALRTLRSIQDGAYESDAVMA